ncbi:hypothetical protein L484_016599 [Morus notabilis]|uniref:Uncharacterized protein n=1 Tax=Morus notabilis TaxID=981085 RepID=W9QTI8_9ROSA|nr:hypothetical protein L484_016599 [Morus notabilis]
MTRILTPNAPYVILSNRLGPADQTDPKELLSFDSGLNSVVIDVHYYSLYTEMFRSMNAQQHIDYIFNQGASDLGTLTTSNGPYTFVGEWSAKWDVKEATMQDYQRFARAMLDVYGRATFGWSYWTYKNQNHN